MTIATFHAELENELEWRIAEINQLQNQLNGLDDAESFNQPRRAILLMLYAHFEGYIKFAFTSYVNQINKENILCRDARPAIVAASFADVFKAMRNPDSKSSFFRDTLPEDSKLHTFARDREFISNLDGFQSKLVQIKDDYIDAEGNLKPAVLRKLLYKVGLPHNLFYDIEGDIHKLLNYRNNIAHGQWRKGLSLKDYTSLKEATLHIMNQITSNLVEALTKKYFLRSASALTIEGSLPAV